jgi:uncharacterized protein (DUF362 family)
MKKTFILHRNSIAGINISSLVFFLAGLAALAWFLIRVIPKPSRAAYPCQQAAFPIASAFVIWLTGILASSFLFTRAKATWRRSKYVIAAVLFFLAMAVFMVTSTSLKHTPALAQAYIFTGNLLGKPLPVMRDFTRDDSLVVEPAAIVGIVKSSQAQAEDIDFDEITAMVNEAIDKAGGLEGIISNGDTVILKPNLVVSVDGTASAHQLNPEVNGITTDYRVVQAVVNIIRELNPSGKIYVMEGSAMGSTAANMTVLNYGQITGIDSMLCLENASGAWGDTTSVYLQGVSLPPGKALYVGANNRYWLHKLYYNADVVISMPVLKNHCYTGATGSVKNVGIGATPATIYAYSPDILRWRIDHENPPRTNLHYFIHDYFMCRPVDFVVMDGLQSIQNGPASTGTTQLLSEDQMNMRLILAGSDPIAVDECYLTDNQLHFSLTVDEEVTKVEVAVDSIFLNQIVIGGFEDFSLNLDTVEISTGSLVKVYAYDRYLNDSCETVIVTTVPEGEISSNGSLLLDITPNPATGEVSVRYFVPVGRWQPVPESEASRGSAVGSHVILTIIDLFGREVRALVDEAKSPGEHKLRVNVSDLPAGVYLVRAQAGRQTAVRKMVVN